MNLLLFVALFYIQQYIWKNVTFEEPPRYFSTFSDFRPLSEE